MMDIEFSSAVKLLQDVGFTHADKYSARDITARLRKLPNIVDENTIIASEASDQLYEQLLMALASQDVVNVVNRPVVAKRPQIEETLPDGTPVDDDAEVMDDDTQPASKRPAITKHKDKKKGKDKPADKPKAGKKQGPPKKEGGGVIASIIKLLLGANSKKPLSLDQITTALAKLFPEREKDAMAKTVKIQVSGRLAKEKGLNVKKNDKGFWIEEKKK